MSYLSLSTNRAVHDCLNSGWVFHCRDEPKLIEPIFCCWTVRLIPVLYYYKNTEWMNILITKILHILYHSLWIKSWKWNFWVKCMFLKFYDTHCQSDFCYLLSEGPSLLHPLQFWMLSSFFLFAHLKVREVYSLVNSVGQQVILVSLSLPIKPPFKETFPLDMDLTRTTGTLP